MPIGPNRIADDRKAHAQTTCRGYRLAKRPQHWSGLAGSSDKNFALDQAAVAACPIQIDSVRLPLGYRG